MKSIIGMLYYFYKISCKDVNIQDCYVGQTTNFKSRCNDHKSCCNNEKSKQYNRKVYQFIRDNGGWVNWTITELERNEYESVEEVRYRERYWYEELKANLNYEIPSRTRKERMINYNKEYREKHKEQLLEYSKEWRNNNDYEHSEKRREYKKNYYQKNKLKSNLKVE